MNRVEKMMDDSTCSEDFIVDVLEERYGGSFYTVSSEDQRDGIGRGWHVADIRSKEHPKVAFEVKEDFKSEDTGNLAFESYCLDGLRRWATYHKMKNVFLVYVNHRTYDVDVFDCAFDVDGLRKELEYLCAFDLRCSEKQGGDQMFKLWILPIDVAKTMKSCVTNRFFSTFQQNEIRRKAKSVLCRG
tara:strand:- start:608 stop:1168 length:561 start_codon:yes stop_codon:yes gene_type:complete